MDRRLHFGGTCCPFFRPRGLLKKTKVMVAKTRTRKSGFRTCTIIREEDPGPKNGLEFFLKRVGLAEEHTRELAASSSPRIPPHTRTPVPLPRPPAPDHIALLFLFATTPSSRRKACTHSPTSPMLSPNNLSHRRRSHSASSPIPRHKPDDVKWRISAKRSRPSSIRSPSYKDLANGKPAEKWDVDQWRRGKRARRGSNSEDSSDEPIGSASDPVFPVQPTTTFTFPSTPTARLPCTSAAFQFFPQKKARKQSARGRISREASPRQADRMSSDEVRRMRADALGELHRSVLDGGEGLVRKMRDWETTRSGSARLEQPATDECQPRRSWRRLTSYYGTPRATEAVPEQLEEDEDDIFIVGGASSLPTSCNPAPKERALSLGMMDVDTADAETHSCAGSVGGDRSSSSIEPSSDPSAYSSDDEGHGDMDVEFTSVVSGPFSTPALSHTYSTSTNSSLVSLPLSAQASESCPGTASGSPTAQSRPAGRSLPSPTLPSTASHSEKAIAALTLAMANGAVGISDYQALLAAEGLTTLDQSHAGELWS
ncbi:hypothetical protein BD414DRAFT_534667 [Trametes punicea]|nr:hypothetical protein BD414DRAFT_534667 [Trametes punicea]